MNKKLSFRILLFLLCAALMLPLVGCGTTPDPVETDPVTEPQETEPQETEPQETEPQETEPQETESDTEAETEPEEEDVDTMWTYVREPSGVLVREITIDSGKGGRPIEIVQISDIHFNLCNEQDFEEANPAVMSTYQYRSWLRDGASVHTAKKCLNYATEADMLVLTGDTLDYLSHGCMELTEENFFEPWAGKILASPGNHEPLRQMEGKVEDKTSLQSRLDILQEGWANDLHYASVVLGEKVMLIQLDNSTMCEDGGTAFMQEQVEPFRADLALAREKGYVVLLFYHIPLATGNPADYRSVSPYDEKIFNFYSGSGLIGRYSKGASKTVYQLITDNADIIKGTFCGHVHNDYYTNIKGTGANGSGHLIPQYVMTASAYNNGHIFRIKVK